MKFLRRFFRAILPTVKLWQYRDSDGVQSLWASQASNGEVRIEGQDLGPGVESVFGEGLIEYEYTFIVQASDVPLLSEALGGGDVLSALKRRFRTRADNVQSFLDEHEIPYDFHNRIGE